MIYLTCALDAEARPLIEHYRLKRDYTLPYTFYKGDGILLLVTGIGRSNAMLALSALMGYRIPTKDDLLINIGICGAPDTYRLGEALLIHQIMDTDRSYYPDILYPHPLRETGLMCVDTPVSSPCLSPVDMESGGIFQAASRFLKLHQMAFIKIVSDHFEPHKVTKEGAIHLVKSHIHTLESLIASLQKVSSDPSLFTPEEMEKIGEWKTHFTVSQGVKLEEALFYFRLKIPKRPLPFPTDPIPTSKRERSTLLETFIAHLTA
ncbi:MAG: hypothetical protein M0P91_00375 [Sulfuricurvum sp.]|jgi:nucleoside phosphorylase|uniref:5'-methylthioadenosine/S-adenosylhomocysteine nucleosidase family protein n=1 Tax=Sulfuricurvum sp. TaxID=2025608 RepID=UPI0025CCBB28|nr:hypothetical protein [Sulfuricurvum sp.]MCK9371624.1 hypothetical protein [Sulfuricurvum sp.]